MLFVKQVKLYPAQRKHAMVVVLSPNLRIPNHVQTLVMHGLSVSGRAVAEMEAGQHLNGVAVLKAVAMALKHVPLNVLLLQVYKIEQPLASAVMAPL